MIKVGRATADAVENFKSFCFSSFWFRQLKPVLKKGFNSLFSAGRPPAGATSAERVSFYATVDRFDYGVDDSKERTGA